MIQKITINSVISRDGICIIRHVTTSPLQNSLLKEHSVTLVKGLRDGLYVVRRTQSTLS
jgi:hypothetical protein